VADRLLSWFFLGVMGGLMPLLAELVLRVALRRPHSLTALIGHGELLLIAVVIGSSAVGTLVSSAASRRVRTVAWGLGFPCLLLLGVFYGGLSSRTDGARSWVCCRVERHRFPRGGRLRRVVHYDR